MKSWPALDVRSSASDLIQFIADDFGPTAIEEIAVEGECDHPIRLFFASAAARDAARAALATRFAVAPIDVPDDDWARRSQQNLAPITVGRITICPSPEHRLTHPESRPPNPASPIPNPICLVILPSMGFGTGHHATTRLCLAALQTLDLTNAFVLDVGTGSGVLAIAAARLGAARTLGIDTDPDAMQSARENLALNPEVQHVAFEIANLTSDSLPQADVVTANLTGALLVRAANLLRRSVRPGGTLIVSGVLSEERDNVRHAFRDLRLMWTEEEEGWVGFNFRK